MAEQGIGVSSSTSTKRSINAGAREVILFYKYVDLGASAPEVANEQRKLCESLSLSGRMRVAPEGINGSVCGPANAVEAYQAWMEASEHFKGIQYKLSRSDEGEEDPFEGTVIVKDCSEITSTGPMRWSKPTALGGSGGEHLKPQDFHNLVQQAQSDDSIVVVDTRNHYETAVGSFRGAVDPKIRNFAQFPNWVEANKEQLKGKHIAMFCTGGIRCEKASAFVKKLGIASKVSQLEGGIHSYLEAFSPEALEGGVRTKRHCVEADTPSASGATEKQAVNLASSQCLYEGINFQFDGRLSKPVVGTGSEVATYRAAKCLGCSAPWNLIRKQACCVVCLDFVLLCDTCFSKVTPTDPDQKREGTLPPISDKSILCFEHQLLSDDWKMYASRLHLTKTGLQNHIQALQKLEELSRGRGKGKRRHTLKLQIERMEELLAELDVDKEEQPAKAQVTASNQQQGFVPFVPCFELETRPISTK
mmetsp:Transcript_12234/g.22695  ORF Transcript_12234/g.22695 Transcript_12234/m.22695 type:complete len:476 (-) Transcript_12234:121-1548(-)